MVDHITAKAVIFSTDESAVVEEIEFKYDPLGRRIEKSSSKGTKHFVWDGNVIVHEYATQDATDAQEDLVTWVFDGGFTPQAKITSKDSYSVISDYLGTPVEAYNSEGKLVWSCELDIYGRVKDFTEIKNIGGYACEEEFSVDFIPHRYQGQMHDIDTGLYYNRYRYFDPETGQYTQQDPIGLAGGNPTLYGYVNDPNILIDPFGLRKVDLSGSDSTGRPLKSSNYSVWFETGIPEEIQSGTRGQHFRNANQQLYEAIQTNPSLANALPQEVVSHVQPGSRGGFSDTSPPKHTWHHSAKDPTRIELVPRGQHRAPGPVQSSLHPNQEGGFKKLSNGCGK